MLSTKYLGKNKRDAAFAFQEFEFSEEQKSISAVKVEYKLGF